MKYYLSAQYILTASGKKLILLFIVLFLIMHETLSQDASNRESEKKAVHKTITNLFDGMREADSAKVHSVFRNDVRLLTTYANNEGEAMLKEGSLKRFLIAVGSPHEEVWNENIEDITIQIDGNLAQVWTNYTFYLGKKFIHCGVNAFQLFKEHGQWKIIQLTDTRRKQGCLTE